MNVWKILFFIIFAIGVHGDVLKIDDKTEFYELLPASKIYIDETRDLTIQDVAQKEVEFQSNDKKLIGFGYSPDFNVWIEFTLKNERSETIEKILEYASPLTTDIELFDISAGSSIKEGLLHISEDRKTLNPTFKIILQPYETRTFYLQASSYVTTMIVQLKLWNTDSLYAKEIKHQLILALFFGAMFVLAIYNLFIFFFTKDFSYLYYVAYILSVAVHHGMYVGIAELYLISKNFMIYIVESAPFLIAAPIYALAFFTKSFLQIRRHTVINQILTLLLILLPLSIVFIVAKENYFQYRNIMPVWLAVFLIFITFYSAYKRNRQAYFIVFGWLVIFLAIVLMNLSSMGIFNIYRFYPYIVETALVLEAIIFSIALADRIKQLQKENYETSRKLINQQRNEKKRLKIQVDQQTKDLKLALDEKGLLLKELNHRVKNNLQTIISLLRLQSDEIDDKRIQAIFLTVQNRINAMSRLHELLYRQDNVSHIDTYGYFSTLISDLQTSYESKVKINLKIDTLLKMEQAIYCGLIMNELVTNSLKYAFSDNGGTIDISLTKENGQYILIVQDNGKGYTEGVHKNSLGLVLVDILVKNQLKGKIETNPSNGVKVEIKWSDYE